MRVSIRLLVRGSAVFLFSSPMIAGDVIAGEQSPLNESTTQPEQVVISASPFGEAAIDSASSVAQVSHGEILTGGGISLGDALKNVPGVSSTGFAAGASRPVIRGFNATRVKVTENGLGSHDTSDVGDDHAVPVDPLASLQVEVLRGPATLRYGSQAIGGVVNAINNRIPIDTGEGTSIEAFTGFASNGLERMGGGLADYRDGPWAFHVDGVIRGADDYDTPLGTQMNSFAFGKGYALGGAYIGSSAAAGLGFNQYVAHYGIPLAPGDTDKKHVDLDQKNYNGEARWDEPLSWISRIVATGGYSNYRHNEVTDAGGVEATFRNKEWENRVELIHKSFGPFTTGALGIQYDNRDFSVLGADADYLHPTKTNSFAAYLFEESEITSALKLQGALRTEWTDVKGDTDALGVFNRHFQPFSAALGAVYKFRDDLSVFLNVSRTERAPAPTELFAQGPHDASGTFEFGNPNAKKEEALSVEGGVKLEHPDGDHASFTVYDTSFDNFIDGFLTGNTRDEDGTFHPDSSGAFKELLYLQQGAHFWGFEGEVHWHLADLWSGRIGAEAQTDYVRATLDNGGNVPRITPFRYGGGLFYESTLMELKLNAMRTGRQNALGAQETPTPGYWMVDAAATFHLYDGSQGDVDLALIANNLTDSVARNAISFTKDYVVAPGRSFRLMLHYMR